MIENLIARVNTKSLSRKRHKLYKKKKRSVCFMKHYSWSMWSWVGFWKMVTLVEIKKAYKKQVLIVSCLLNSWHKPIMFTLKNKDGWLFSYKNILVITIVLSNLRAQGVLIDNASMMNIFSRKNGRIDGQWPLQVGSNKDYFNWDKRIARECHRYTITIATYPKYCTLW